MADEAIGIDRLAGNFLECHGAENLIRLNMAQDFGGIAGVSGLRIDCWATSGKVG